MEFVLLGIFLGVTVGIAPGPVTVYMVQKTIAEGRLRGMLVVLGVMLSDALYASLALVGVATILREMAAVTMLFWFITGALLIFMGAGSFFQIRRDGIVHLHRTNKAFARSHPLIGGFLVNFFGPPTIVFWAAMSFTFLPKSGATLAELYTSHAVLVNSGVLLGSALCFILLVNFVSFERERDIFSNTVWKLGTELLGIVLAAMGVFFVSRGFGALAAL